MQVIFLAYHYFHAGTSVYNLVRVLIGAYVWMTGFGHFCCKCLHCRFRCGAFYAACLTSRNSRFFLDFFPFNRRRLLQDETVRSGSRCSHAHSTQLSVCSHFAGDEQPLYPLLHLPDAHLLVPNGLRHHVRYAMRVILVFCWCFVLVLCSRVSFFMWCVTYA
jgi:hypothetical protein